jgi:hypothetical protein
VFPAETVAAGLIQRRALDAIGLAWLADHAASGLMAALSSWQAGHESRTSPP